MKKIIFLKTMLLAVVMMAGSGSVFGQGSEEFSHNSTATSYGTINWTGTNGLEWSATDARGDQTITADNKAITVRIGSITGELTPAQQTAGIGTIKFDYKIPYSDATKNITVTITAGSKVIEHNIGKITQNTIYNTGDIVIGSTDATNIILAVSSVAAGARLTIDNLSWTENGTSSTAAPTFTPAGGTYTSAQNVELTSATAGASIYYTTNGTDPNNTGNGTLYVGTPINVTTTTTIKAIAYADGLEPSAIATATYTFPPSVSNIAEFLATTETGNVIISGPVIVVYQNGQNLYIQDSSGSLLVYGNAGKTFTNGDVLTGLMGTLGTFGGAAQMTSPVAPDAVSGTAIEPTVFDLSTVNTADLAKYVKVENVQFTADVTFSTSSTVNGTLVNPADFTVRDNFRLGGSVLAAKQYDIVGFISYYNDTPQLFPVEIIEVIPETPTILVAPATIDFGEVEIDVTTTPQSIEVTGYNLTTAPSYEITGDNSSEFAVSGTLTVDGGEMSVTFSPTSEGEKTATLTITSGTVSQTVSLSGTGRLPKEPSVVISQVYGGGGNSGAIYTHDFIELYNLTDSEINLTGWSVQYTSATGSFSTNITELSGIIKAGHYYLIQQAKGNGGTEALPTPDIIGEIAMGATNMKVALANNTEAITGINDPSVIDFVGTGTANEFETSKAPAGSNTKAVIRIDFGATDTDDNGNDFLTGDPRPRNSSYYLASEENAFRSQDTGDWSSTGTWEGSYDEGTNWYKIGNDIIPSQMAASISIQPDHLVTVDASANATASTLIIQPKGMLTVGEGTLETGSLQILSDATGTGTVLNYSGEAEVQQYSAEKRTYYMGVPVNPLNAVSGIENFATFNFSSDTWTSATSVNEDNIDNIPTGGQGFLAQSPAGTMSFTGLLNNDDVEIELLQGVKNFNYYGNPYPSYLNSTSVLNGGTTDGTLWQRTKGGSGFYFVTFNPADGGTSLPSGNDGSLIAPMQGFWVNAATAGTFTFTNAMRTHNVNGTGAFKAPRISNSQKLLLSISNENMVDEALVRFNSEAGEGITNWDSRKMMNGASGLNIYTVAEGVNLAINSQTSITEGVEIPVGVQIGTGTYKISVKEFSNFASGTKVNLIDKATGTVTNLSETDYDFTLTENLNSTSRFALVFPKADASTGLNDVSKDEIFAFVRDGRIVVNTADAAEGSMIYVFNGVGQRIVSKIVTGTVNELNNSLPAGVYVVKLNNRTTKVVVK